MDHLISLNEAQKEAVLATEGPVLVLAGAGAGKTRTIAHRVVHIVKGGVSPEHVLAITFTNKAAREMRNRILSLLAQAGEVRSPTVSTFHALSVQLLRSHAQLAGISRYFTIFDRADSLRAIKHAIRAVGEDEKRFEPRSVLSSISRAKADALTQTAFRERGGGEWYPTLVAEVWSHYAATLRKEQALDFDDLLLELQQLLARNKGLREELGRRWRYVHIDEYQDTNRVQYEIARMLAEEHGNLFCVGDLDQNVYSWRGSTIENILEFERTYPNATVLRLEENYRSTKTIVEVSNEVIRKNRRRKEKTLFTNNPIGDKLALIVGFDERDEARRIVQKVRALIEGGVGVGDIALLYRANFQSRALEEAFLEFGVPYRVLGTRFFDRAEVKDVLSYVRAALNPRSEVDLRRVVNTPARGIGKVSLEKLLQSGLDSLSGAARRSAESFFSILSDIKTKVEHEPASHALAFALERSGIAQSLGGKDEESQERLGNVRELVSLAAERYDAESAPNGMLQLLEDASLATEQDELDARTTKGASDAVTLMTIHAAKGLEFEHTFITGLEEGLFPHDRADTTERGADDEEERRLFYVALTRAKRRVYLSYAQVRTVFGQRNVRMPSEFIFDIDEAYLESEETREPVGKVVYLD